LDPYNFTLIAWDPPGYGNSRPPVRFYDKDVYLRDAQMAAKLMKVLIKILSIMISHRKLAIVEKHAFY
jgi:pimeloyl-ACP methyl ester carboxylesterase